MVTNVFEKLPVSMFRLELEDKNLNLHYNVVSSWLPPTMAQVRSQVMTYRTYCGKCGSGAGFLRVLGFPVPILVPRTAPHSSSSIIQGWYDRPNSGQHIEWTQSHPTPRIN
jgi:hypothetical protein